MPGRIDLEDGRTLVVADDAAELASMSLDDFLEIVGLLKAVGAW